MNDSLFAQDTPLTQKPAFPTSVLGNTWQFTDADARTTLALTQKFELPDIAARLLASRGITVETAELFLNPSIKDLLPDPHHLKDMDKAAERLADAIEKQQSVVVFGDYDVDGATSSATLMRFCTSAGLNIRYYIPDRIEEGYGPNAEALLKLRKEGADLAITVDCGTVAYEPLEAAAKAGLEIIVIDHHLSDGGVR